MSIPHNTDDTTLVRVTILIFNLLGELDDSAEVETDSELQISKNGAAWVDATGTLESTGGGAYYYQGVLGDADTIGTLKVKFAKSGFVTAMAEEVVTADSMNAVVEGSHTGFDLLRGAIAAMVAKSSGYNTGTIEILSLDGSKTRWTITTDATGRLTCEAGDLT